MKFTTSALSAFLLVATTPVITSFVSPNLQSRTRVFDPLSLSPDDLTDYMAKAHNEKLRAVKEVETKKNEEIQSLKGEVAELKTELSSVPRESAVVMSSGTPPPSAGADLSKLTTEELRQKLVQYQEFMAKYIVQAQQQKMKAVRAAELATAAKYEEKIKFLLAASEKSDVATAAAPAAAASTPETKLYDTRSANVAAAGKAGKSRWGDAEVAKVKITSGSNFQEVKPDVEQLNGKANTAPAPASVSLPGSGLFDERNKKVAAAAAAGKSRWGDAEAKKATADASKTPSLSSAPAPTPAPAAAKVSISLSSEIEAADHGLRNDGGVGGPSLAERVNLGQQLFTGGAVEVKPAAPKAPIAVTSLMTSTYNLRNARVAAAASAGKSRWGSMENARASTLATASKTLGATAVAEKPSITTTAEIEAADHGLRNDGGVGGPSLAERINLGSKLL